MSGFELDTVLLERVRARLVQAGGDLTASQVAAAMRAEGALAGDVAVLEAVESLRRDTVGAGPLDDLLRLDGVTDVLVNGPAQVFVDVGNGLELTGIRFPDDATVRRLAQRLAATAGRRLDDASPFVDVRLADGSRFHAVLAPVARSGTSLSLRIPARRSLSLSDLVATGTLDAAGAQLLSDLVRSSVAFVVSGGTGSGKTTLLQALLSHVSPSERMVIVEDAHELRPRHPHVVSLEARHANVEGSGEISLRDLVRQALRMRPDRLVVGEVRGAEVVDLLAALNTGHEGGCGTLHANSALDVPARLEALGIAAGLPRDAVHAQIGAALHAVIHLHRDRDRVRRVAQLAVLQRRADGLVEAVVAMGFTAEGSVPGPGADRLAELLARDVA